MVLGSFAVMCAGYLGAQTAEDLLLTNVHVIVGNGDELLQTDVLLRDGRIAAVGEEISAADRQSRVVDLTGKTLMPALIDGHSHLGYQSVEGWGAEHYSRENLIRNLQQYLYYGFAAVFSAGSDPDDLALALGADQREQNLPMARFLFAAGMAPPGQGPNNQFLGHTSRLEQELGMTILRGLESPEQARQQVREVNAKGIQFIKLWVDDRNGSQTKLSPELYRAVAMEARALGMKVFIHQQFAEDMPDIISSGAHGFLHGRIGAGFSNWIAFQAAANDVFVVPNLGLGELRRETIGRDSFLSPLLSAADQSRLSDASGPRQVSPQQDRQYENELAVGFTRLKNAGVELVLGTDAGAVPDHPFGYTGHRELEIFVRLGVSEMDALVAATGNAAKHLGLSDSGEIKAGNRADLLILNSNPLNNIRNTRDIHQVYFAGQEINRAELLQQILQN